MSAAHPASLNQELARALGVADLDRGTEVPLQLTGGSDHFIVRGGVA